MKTHKLVILSFLALFLSGTISCSSPNDEPSGPSSSNGDDPGAGVTPNPSQPSDTTSDSQAQVIFYDDFEGLDSVPDTTKWVLCQRSTPDWARYLSESYDQAYQKDGYLYLVGQQSDGQYLTGGIETRGKFSFTEGKVECRARFLRQPTGNHTGIWMMPAPPAEQWPKSGEIDIMEHLGNEDKVYQTVHSWYIDNMGHTTPVAQQHPKVDNTEWNIYGLEWTSDSITYTINGVPYLSYPNLRLSGEDGAYQWPFDHPFYLILSQSLGGPGTWAGPIDNTALPAVFQIDWIKVTKP